jgi:hypothetical protein
VSNLQARVSAAEEQLADEGIKAGGEDVIITCVEEGEMFNERGERVPVPEPIGFDEGRWFPTRSGRMRTRWAIYPDHRLLRDCDREEQGLPPLADHGIVRDESVTGD